MQVGNIRKILITVIVATSCLLEFKPVLAATSASEYRALGLSYRASERYAEAIAALKKSVKLEPQNLSGRVMLGWTQHLAGQEDAAIESLIQVLCRDPASVPALNALGIVYLVSGKLNTAVFVHTWAAILEPKNEVAYYNLSLAFHRLQIYDSAIITAKKAATLEPSNPHPLLALALAHWDSGDRASAKLAYRQAQNLDFRYSDRSFLAHLKKAGFSTEQINTTKQILSAIFR
jgi:Flp pilus assembly protein TadD